jgi:hypothetical protein
LTNWVLDIALANSYKLSFHSPVAIEDKWTDQEKFRIAILEACFTLGKQARLKRKRSSISTTIPVLDTPLEAHSIIRREYPQNYVVCKKEGTSKGVSKRQALGEISANQLPNLVGKGCRKTTRFGYGVCNTPLCKDSTCFARFHGIDN